MVAIARELDFINKKNVTFLECGAHYSDGRVRGLGKGNVEVRWGHKGLLLLVNLFFGQTFSFLLIWDKSTNSCTLRYPHKCPPRRYVFSFIFAPSATREGEDFEGWKFGQEKKGPALFYNDPINPHSPLPASATGSPYMDYRGLWPIWVFNHSTIVVNSQ